MILKTINSLQSESQFEFLWQKIVQQADLLEMTPLYLPGKQKQPAKLLNENEAPLCDEVSSVKMFYTRIYFNAIDTVTNYIKALFSQPGYRAVKTSGNLF